MQGRLPAPVRRLGSKVSGRWPRGWHRGRQDRGQDRGRRLQPGSWQPISRSDEGQNLGQTIWALQWWVLTHVGTDDGACLPLTTDPEIGFCGLRFRGLTNQCRDIDSTQRLTSLTSNKLSSLVTSEPEGFEYLSASSYASLASFCSSMVPGARYVICTKSESIESKSSSRPGGCCWASLAILIRTNTSQMECAG